jgi:membrane protease YdiL (CAAX protease family)
MMQGLGILFRNRWMPLLLTSVIFGLMHLGNPEVEKLGYGIMIFYIGTGFFLGIITLMDEGLELALGFHAANNLVTALLVTSEWTAFQTDSLLKDVAEPGLEWDAYLPLLLFPLLLFFFAWKYGWTNWKQRLTGGVLSAQEAREIFKNQES